MPIGKINDIELFWESIGDKGETLILVHGSCKQSCEIYRSCKEFLHWIGDI